MNPTRQVVDTALAGVFREEAGRITAALVRALGDFALAEEAVQDALVAALEHWPAGGVPERPGAWLFTVARRRALDALRRAGRQRDKLPDLDWRTMRDPDDRLRLIFTCCHPALSREAQVALTLRAVWRTHHCRDRPRLRHFGGNDRQADRAGQTQDRGRRGFPIGHRQPRNLASGWKKFWPCCI